MVVHSRIDLPGQNGQLSLLVGEPDWTEVVLASAEQRLNLGAERVRLIAHQLITFLEQRDSEMTWVLSLAERHHSVYGKHEEGKTVLSFQDADGSMVATLEVSDAQRLEWTNLLRPHVT